MARQSYSYGFNAKPSPLPWTNLFMNLSLFYCCYLTCTEELLNMLWRLKHKHKRLMSLRFCTQNYLAMERQLGRYNWGQISSNIVGLLITRLG